MALWKLHGDGTIRPGEVVAPHERLTWPRTVGLGAQHVVAMFGATFVFPLLMGLNPQLAVMMSGIATLLFLLIVRGRVPSYLGSSASFVGVAAAIYAAGGNPSHLTGALMIVAIALLLVGIVIHLGGAQIVHAVLPPVVTGAVVMLIGFNLAPVVAKVYWPKDQWVALLTMLLVVGLSVGVKGFLSRIAIFVALIVGYIVSWLFDLLLGPVKTVAADGTVTSAPRVDWSQVEAAPWFGLPPVSQLGSWVQGDASSVVGFHLPAFSFQFALVALPVVIALIAENTGHVKAVAEMTGENLDGDMGRAIAADGVGSVVATAVGAGPTTTYAENIGVMAATRVYSTAAYTVAAIVAIGFGFSPKFGAIISATPAGVLGGITVVLYGMIGLLGAKIWKENGVDFGRPLNLVPVAAGLIIGIGDVTLTIGEFSLAGIGFGTIVTVGVYHFARWLAVPEAADEAGGTTLVLDAPHMYEDDDSAETPPHGPQSESDGDHDGPAQH